MSVAHEPRIGHRREGLVKAAAGEVLLDQGVIGRMDVASARQARWRSNVQPISVAKVVAARSHKDTEATLRGQSVAEHRARIAERSGLLTSCRPRSPTATSPT